MLAEATAQATARAAKPIARPRRLIPDPMDPGPRPAVRSPPACPLPAPAGPVPPIRRGSRRLRRPRGARGRAGDPVPARVAPPAEPEPSSRTSKRALLRSARALTRTTPLPCRSALATRLSSAAPSRSTSASMSRSRAGPSTSTSAKRQRRSRASITSVIRARRTIVPGRRPFTVASSSRRALRACSRHASAPTRSGERASRLRAIACSGRRSSCIARLSRRARAASRTSLPASTTPRAPNRSSARPISAGPPNSRRGGSRRPSS